MNLVNRVLINQDIYLEKLLNVLSGKEQHGSLEIWCANNLEGQPTDQLRKDILEYLNEPTVKPDYGAINNIRSMLENFLIEESTQAPEDPQSPERELLHRLKQFIDYNF